MIHLYDLIGTVPISIVAITGIVLGFITMKDNAGRAACVIIAMFLILIIDLFFYLLFVVGENYDIYWILNFRYMAYRVAYPVLSTASYILLLVTAFAWRKPSAGVSFTPEVHHQPMKQGEPTAMQTRPDYFPTRPINPISKGLYIGMIYGSLVLSIVLYIPAIFLLMEGGRDEEMIGAILSCSAVLPVILGSVFICMLVYKAWAAIQEGPVRTTPGKAVGFLFIPLFNFYWIFQAYYGWAVDYNKYITSANLNLPRISQGVPLTLCILALCGIIPFVGILLALVNLILGIIFINSVINGVNRLSQLQSADHQNLQQESTPASL